MNITLQNLSIAAVATSLPANKLELVSLGEEFGQAEVARIIKSTGIHAVRHATSLRASDLCYAAAKAVVKEMDMNPSAIDGLVFVSQTPDRIMPATSATLQHRLGLPTKAVAFDIAYGCSGYIYGLFQASLLVSSGACERVLVLAGDVISPLVRQNDRSLRMVLGDGGSATIVQRGASSCSFALRTDGAGSTSLIVPRADEVELSERLGAVPGYLHMDGSEVMAFALREVPAAIAEALGEARWSPTEVGFYGLHQANQFILHYLRRKLGVSMERLPTAIDDIGNTGPASIPLLLSRVGRTTPAQARRQSVLCGFGVGLSWGAMTADLSQTVMLPPIEL